MSSINNERIISNAHPHTIKKFELIEKYTEAWIQKLMNYPKCDGVVFIDCMCNSGVYYDDNGRKIFGTPIRVAKILYEAMKMYPIKNAKVYYNDLSKEKIEELNKHLPENTNNFSIYTSCMDGNDLLKQLAKEIAPMQTISYLVVYDPYTANIDWKAVMPFLNCWGEVIINHVLSDSIRGVAQAIRPEVIDRYQHTYLTSIEDLVTFGSDRSAYEQRVEDIITSLRGAISNRYYIATFPFFNTRNSLVYDLIHCTNSAVGFRLFKTTAWKTFGGKSSTKNTHGLEQQLVFQLDESENSMTIATVTDEYCYYVQDIVEYLMNKYHGKKDVPLEEVWNTLDEHPIFPADGYKKEIKAELKYYGNIVSKSGITFADRS